MISQVAHLAHFARNPACRVVCVADSRPELARRVSEKFSVPKAYASHCDLLADAEVEAVVVVAPRAATGPMVLDALTAGKHVLSEKPMAQTAEQAARLTRAAAESGVLYSVGFMKRHDSGVQQAKAMLDDLVESGELGPVVMTRCYDFCRGYGVKPPGFIATGEHRPERLETWPVPAWLPDELTETYDWFLNVAVHDVNLLRYLLGNGRLSVRFAEFSHPRGCVAILDAGDHAVVLEVGKSAAGAWRQGVEIYFECGRLLVELPSPMQRDAPARVVLDRNVKEPQTVAPAGDGSWAFARQSEAFVTDIAAGREPLASGADSVADLELIEDIWHAYLGEKP